MATTGRFRTKSLSGHSTQNMKTMDSTYVRRKTAARMTVSRVVPRWSSDEVAWAGGGQGKQKVGGRS